VDCAAKAATSLFVFDITFACLDSFLGDGTVDRSARFMMVVLVVEVGWARESAVYIDAVRVLGPSHTQVATTGLTGKLGRSSFRFEYFMFGQLDELHIWTSARRRAHSSVWLGRDSFQLTVFVDAHEPLFEQPADRALERLFAQPELRLDLFGRSLLGQLRR
jgi:hypothetical protein